MQSNKEAKSPAKSARKKSPAKKQTAAKKSKSSAKRQTKGKKKGGQGDDGVVIGDFTFRLIGVSQFCDYDIVSIKSINNASRVENNFAVYRSMSCTFWRFAQAFCNTFDKGSDYVQTTFIHLNLQKHIEENIVKLKVSNQQIQYVDRICDIEYISMFSMKDDDVINGKSAKTREIASDDDGFKPMRALPSGYCLNMSFTDNATAFIKNIDDDEKRTAMISKIDSLQKNGEPDVCKLIDMVNHYMENEFELLVTKPTILFEKEVVFNNTSLVCKLKNKEKVINSKIQFFEIQRKQKEEKEEKYHVYFMTLTCKKKEAGNNKQDQIVIGKNIVLVLPAHIEHEKNITENGMYANYVNVGMYASKALEYCDQSNIVGDKEGPSYVGKCYNALFQFMKLWPFQQTTNQTTNNCAQWIQQSTCLSRNQRQGDREKKGG